MHRPPASESKGAKELSSLMQSKTEIGCLWYLPMLLSHGARLVASHPWGSTDCRAVLLLQCLLQSVGVTLHSPGGHSSMPPVDSSSIGARLGVFLSALSASPPTPRLVSPTRELVAGLVQLSSPWMQSIARLLKVGMDGWSMGSSIQSGGMSAQTPATAPCTLANRTAPPPATLTQVGCVFVCPAGVCMGGQGCSRCHGSLFWTHSCFG